MRKLETNNPFQRLDEKKKKKYLRYAKRLPYIRTLQRIAENFFELAVKLLFLVALFLFVVMLFKVLI